MASGKVNFAQIMGMPTAAETAKVMEAYGFPADGELGTFRVTHAQELVTASLLCRKRQQISQLDAETQEITQVAVEKVQCLPFAVWPHQERLEVYAGGIASVEHVAAHLSCDLALKVVVDKISIDVLLVVEKMRVQLPKFSLRSVKLTDYAHNSFMIGPYSPKLLDTQHGIDLMEQYHEAVSTANVRWQAANGSASASIHPNASVSFSCHEDDTEATMATLRQYILGIQ